MNSALVIFSRMKKIITLLSVLLPLFSMGQSKFNQFKAQKYVLEGVKNLYKENYQGAVGHFNKAVDLHPTNRDVYVFRANAFYKLDEFELALNDYENAIRIQGEKAELYFRRGLTFERLGLYEEASRDYDYALDVDPRHTQAQRGKTRVGRRRNNPGNSDDWAWEDSQGGSSSTSDDEWWEGLHLDGESRSNGNSGSSSGGGDEFDFDDPAPINTNRKLSSFVGEEIIVRKAPKDMEILQVELAQYTTRILIQYSNVSNSYQQLYLDPPSTSNALYVTDMRFESKYHLTNIYRSDENLGNWRNNTIPPGKKLRFYLEFERIPDFLEVFQIRTGDKENTEKWNFYGVILKK